MLPLLLLLLEAPSPSMATVRTHTLVTLTEQQARPLLGHRARYRVELDSRAEDLDARAGKAKGKRKGAG
jgi:hypothetical protein